MQSSYKFFKHRNGISAFAEVAISSEPSSDFHVGWADDLVREEQDYRNAVREGVAQAARWHTDLGGEHASFTICRLVELRVDTKEDAVLCAAAMAAWKALGHPESEIEFVFDGTWRPQPVAKGS